MEIIRLPSAQADVDDLWIYIATMDVAAADRTVDRIVAATERLKRFPLSGRERSEMHSELRSVPAAPYVIFYRVAANRIEIVRVIHGARDVPAMLNLA